MSDVQGYVVEAVAAERRKYWGPGSMGWDGEGAGGMTPPAAGVRASTQKMFGQNAAVCILVCFT